MILAIGRYAALLGFTFAALLHVAGYFYLDLPHLAFEILTLGILALVPLALRGPFLDSRTPIDTLAKKMAARLAAGGLVLWLLMTFIWIAFVRAPDVGIGPHPIRFSALLPVWRISEPHYRMLYQQWQSLAGALVYVFVWLQFSSEKVVVSAADSAMSAGSSEATGSFPPIVTRLISGTILASVCLFLVGWVLHLVGLVEQGASDFMAGLSVVGIIAGVALAGIGTILGTLRDGRV
jgi:hypothetical protein